MGIEHLQSTLDVEIHQLSDAGRKEENQDAIGARVPDGSLLAAKGFALVIADGVSAAEAAREASQASVTGFLTDYFSTPDTWSVKRSALKVMQSLNRWLYGQGQSHIQGRGFLTTFSALIIKSNTVHIFHVGDSRIYRFRHQQLELLTTDHTRHLSKKQFYLSRAMGADATLDIDYRCLDLQAGDCFLLTTDGIHDVLPNRMLHQSLRELPRSDIPQYLINKALDAGSSDNLSCQIAYIPQLQSVSDQEAFKALSELPFPPDLDVGNRLDGYEVIRLLHASERSQLYLVKDVNGRRWAMKTPSVNYQDDPAYIERFVLEEWIASRMRSTNIVRAITPVQRQFLYYLTEYIPGQTLEQVIHERSPLDVKDAIAITEQTAKALRALHQKETLHQDIKPANIIISKQGAVLIDFGSCLVAGIEEISAPFQRDSALGTAEYSAPEYRYQGPRSERSDQFSLAVITYEMMTGHHPYGAGYTKAKSLSDFIKLNYQSATHHNPLVPLWLDGALNKALSIKPEHRYEVLSEFLFDLKQPNPNFNRINQSSLLDRNPLRFWQSLAAIQVLIILALIYFLID
jgi:serine/threonine protein kinase/serine/threonine protein phosphatase PrpC